MSPNRAADPDGSATLDMDAWPRPIHTWERRSRHSPGRPKLTLSGSRVSADHYLNVPLETRPVGISPAARPYFGTYCPYRRIGQVPSGIDAPERSLSIRDSSNGLPSMTFGVRRAPATAVIGKNLSPAHRVLGVVVTVAEAFDPYRTELGRDRVGEPLPQRVRK